MPLSTTALEAIESLCGHLTERTASLFLGAGVNAGATNSDGEEMPFAQQLSEWICRDLLDEPSLSIPLDEAAEIARYRVSPQGLNDYLYKRLTTFRYGTAHLAAVQLPWDVIFTTNYDLLLEGAATNGAIEAAGHIKAIMSTATDLSAFSEEDIIYYKLHGTIDLANTEEGRLILTKEDYRYYERHRKPLFRRLETDLLSRTFLYIGYSLRDPNFRSILDDCRDELGTKTLPLSYAVWHSTSPVEETYWREKYNIQLIAADAAQFLQALKDTWREENRRVVPFAERRARVYAHVDESTRFQKVGDSFYRVSPADCTGPSDPGLFYHGAEPSWADVRDKIAPARDNYWTLMEGLFGDLLEASAPVTVYLVTGHAGTGKTTLMRQAAYDIAHDFGVPVLVHIPSTPLDARLLGPLVDQENMRRIVVFIHHAADYLRDVERFVEELRRLELPVSIILEERRNQWTVAAATVGRRLAPAEIELGEVSQDEIDRILTALAAHRCLGKLEGTPIEYQRDHFAALAQKELLIALRELTSPKTSFDDIVRDEFESIPSSVARRAYVFVAALGQINVPLRYSHLVRLLDVRFDQLGEQVFRPTDGVLVSGEASGSSRHNSGFNLRTRHPIIASIIFASAAPDDRSKFEIINDIIGELDPGYGEDRRLLEEIVRRKEIVNTLAAPDNRRAIYDRLKSVLPSSPYVLQHRSILERDLGDPALAIRYAREAVAMDRRNPVLQNTLGMALEYAARDATEPLPRQALLTEATKLFDEGIRRDPSDPYAYIGKVNLLKQRIDDEQNKVKRAVLEAEALSLLEEAYEATSESPVIASALADQRQALGDPEQAIAVLEASLKGKPTDARLRDLLIQFESEEGRFEKALKIAQAGVKFDPTSWRLQRHVARLMRVTGGQPAAIRGHYEAAIRHRKGDVGLMVELGAYLFIKGLRQEAAEIFLQSRDLPISAQEKRMIREWWKDDRGQKVVFSGKVKSIRGASAVALAIPDNFEAFLWRTEPRLAGLTEDSPIRFHVAFNAFGSIARVLE